MKGKPIPSKHSNEMEDVVSFVFHIEICKVPPSTSGKSFMNKGAPS